MKTKRARNPFVDREIRAGEPLLEIEDLSVFYTTRDMGVSKAVNHVTLSLLKGETLGLVGETGAGKTTIALSIMGLIECPPGEIVNGTIRFKGQDIYALGRNELQKIRGSKISMIFQDPMTALNAVDTVGEQIAEVILLHENCGKAEARRKAEEMMETVGIPRERYGEYPYQFSGGMIQRIVIAIALACSPELLLADEPTTALDVTIQAQVLDMINELKAKLGTSVLMITHDLGIIAEMCDRVAVIYAGEVVEFGDLEQIFHGTAHPYTMGLFNSLPNAAGDSLRLKPIRGLMPDPAHLPEGCKFCDRCEYADEGCFAREPALEDIGGGHLVRCFHHSCFREKGG